MENKNLYKSIQTDLNISRVKFLRKIFLVLSVFILGASSQLSAQIAAWDFTGIGGTTIASTAATTFNANLVTTSGANTITRGAGAAWSTGANSWRTTGFQNNGIATTNTDYFQITLTATSGNLLSLSTIDAKFAGTASFAASPGVSSQFAYSLDGTTFTLIGTPSVTVASPATLTQINVSGITALQNVVAGTTVTLRYYASGQTATGGWGFNSPASGQNGLAIGGSVIPAAVPPTQLVLTSISNQTAGAPFSFTVEARDGSNTLRNVSSTTNFSLTTNGNAGAIGGTTTGTITSGASSVIVSGVTLSSAGTGATIIATQTSGTDVLSVGTSNSFNVSAAASPLITITGSLTPFSTVVGTPSTTQSYSVSGANLSTDITITPPTDFEIRTGVNAFSNSPITLTQSGGTVGSTNIDVRYNPASAGSTGTVNITHTTTGDSKNQPVSGSSIAAEPTIASTVTFGAVTPSSIVINFSGGDGANRIVVVKAGGFVNLSIIDGVSFSGVNSVFSSATDQGGSGNKVVYDGSANTVTVTGLNSTTAYHVAVYEYNGTGVTSNYLSTGGINNTTTTAPTLSYSTIGSTYNQSFDNLPNTGTYTFAGAGPFYTVSAPINATATDGWQFFKYNVSASNALFSFNDGLGTSGSAYSYGTAAASDRAFGTLLSGTTKSNIGLVVTNNTGSTLSYLNITYVGEQWRFGGSGADSLVFGYLVGGTDISTGTFTPVVPLNFVGPVITGTAGALNGNSPANRATRTATVTLNAPWLNGTNLVIRWEDIDRASSDNGLAIDGFSFSASAVAAPTQLAVTSVNSGNSPSINVPFSVQISSVDNSNFPQNVLVNTDISITLNTGTGSLGGTLTGTILAGTSSVIISGLTYNTAETGVSITATRTAGDALSSANSSSFSVLGAADHLIFVGAPTTGGTFNKLTQFTVEARRADNSVDINYTGLITLTKATGPGVLIGTTSVAAVGGIATFNNLMFDLVGTYTIDANSTGLTLATTGNIVITPAAYMTELVVPKYMGSKTDAVLNLNNTRTPVATCVQFYNLTPNTAYDLKAGMSLVGEGASGYGAGNWWDGTTFGQNNKQNAFTTDASGNTGPVWVYLQPSGNASRFGAGQIHNIRVGVTVHLASMPANPQFIGAKTITSLDVAAVPLTGSTTDDGAYVTGHAATCVEGKHVLLYDNVSGTGDPLYSYLIRQASVTNGSSSELPSVVNEIWTQTGASVVGDFAGVIPANFTAGVRRVESRNEDNSIFGASTDADGIWPSGANSTNVASKGIVALTSTDAPAIDFVLPTCVSVTATNTSCPTNVVLSWPSSGACDNYRVYFGTDNPPTDMIFAYDNGTSLSYNLPVLASNSVYYYQVVPENVFGAATLCSVGTFTTGSTFTVTPTQTAASYKETFEGVTPPTLPCGVTIEDSNFPNDLQTWVTSSAAPFAGVNSIAIDKNQNNTTAKDDWFYSAPMNLTAGRLYRIYVHYKVSNAATPEQFEVFLSQSADAATMTSTSAIMQKTNLTNTSYALDSTTDIITLVSGVYYYGVHANSVANSGTLYMDDIQIREIPVAALNPASCTTIPSLYDQLLVQPIYGAQDYKFKIENLANSFSYEYTRNLPIPDFRLKWAPGVVYDLTYDVSVSYKKNNVWSPYGASCPVTMGPFPTTQLRGASCGATLTDQYTSLYIDSVGGANDYEYRISQATLAYDHTWLRGAPSLDYRLYWAYQSTPTLVDHLPFGFTYDVQVRALVGRTGAAQGFLPGVWGTFGPVCTVTLAGQPQTQLKPTSCGITLATMTDQIFCLPVAGASNYRYHVVNTALGYDVLAVRNSSSNDYRLSWLQALSGVGLRYSTTYDITVSDFVGGVWSAEGPMCQVTTPASPLTALQPAFCPYVLPTFSSTVNCIAVPAATNYRYRITDVATSGATYTKVRDRNAPSTDFKFSWTLVCCGGLNMQPNTAYNVEVASYAGGVWSAYGPSCIVVTGASVPRYSPFIAEEGLTEAAQGLYLNVYPNPASTAEEFAVELTGIQAANEKIQLSIFNLLGEKVYRSEIVTKTESNMVIKPEQILTPGVYMVEVTINGAVYREKFIVK